jgi:hypothetical protein
VNIRFVELDLFPLIIYAGSAGSNATEESNQKYGNGIQHLFTHLSEGIPNMTAQIEIG